jgi:hypothetical protein
MLLGLLFARPAGSAAQQTYSAGEARVATAGAGGGGIFDWIHKLSGPRFVGGGGSAFFQFGSGTHGKLGPRVRLSGSTRTSINRGKVVPADANISMNTLQLVGEYTIQPRPRWLNYRFYVGAGIAIHEFGGDVDEFSKRSVPVTVGIRRIEGIRWRPFGLELVPVLSGTVHFFGKFNQDDFAPLMVDVPRDKGEAILQFTPGVDIRF